MAAGPVRNIAETAEYLRVSERMVRSLIASGELAHRRIGVGRIVTTQDDLDQYLDSHRHGEAA